MYDVIYMQNLQNKANETSTAEQKQSYRYREQQVLARGEGLGGGKKVGEGD